MNRKERRKWLNQTRFKTSYSKEEIKQADQILKQAGQSLRDSSVGTTSLQRSSSTPLRTSHIDDWIATNCF